MTWLEFDGVNDHIVLPDLGLCEDKTFSYEVWYRTPKIPSGSFTAIIDERSSTSATPFSSLILESSSGKMIFWMKDDAAAQSLVQSAGLLISRTPGMIYHAVATCGAGAMKGYLNGVEVLSGAPPGGTISVNLATIGAARYYGLMTGTYFTKGGIASARMYPFALTPTEVLQNYAAGPDQIASDVASSVFFSVDSDTQLAVTTPAGSGTMDVVVETDFGFSPISANDEFTYPIGLIPTISGINPTSALEGAVVVITGTNFKDLDGVVVVTAVAFTGATAGTFVSAPFSVTSATSLSVTVPEGAALTPGGVITVYSIAGSATSATFICDGTAGAIATAAQTTANGKNTVHYETDAPNSSDPNIVGDIWFQYGDVTPPGGSLMHNVCTHQYTGAGETGTPGVYAWTSTAMSNLVVTSVDASAITAGTISVAIELTSATITGAVIRTSATTTARRILLRDNGTFGELTLESGQANQVDPASIACLGSSSKGTVYITGFDWGVTPARILIESSTAGSGPIILEAATAVLSIDYDTGVNITGAGLTVEGAIRSAPWGDGQSDDGLFIQDADNSANQWKIYMKSDGGVKKLYARLDGNTFKIFTGA